MPFDPDDPRLTAFALGELDDPADRDAIEAQLRDDPACRQLVDDVRATARLLDEALHGEPRPGLAPPQHRVIESRLRRRFPLRPVLALGGLVAAAGVMAVLYMKRPTQVDQDLFRTQVVFRNASAPKAEDESGAVATPADRPADPQADLAPTPPASPDETPPAASSSPKTLLALRDSERQAGQTRRGLGRHGNSPGGGAEGAAVDELQARSTRAGQSQRTPAQGLGYERKDTGAAPPPARDRRRHAEPSHEFAYRDAPSAAREARSLSTRGGAVVSQRGAAIPKVTTFNGSTASLESRAKSDRTSPASGALPAGLPAGPVALGDAAALDAGGQPAPSHFGGVPAQNSAIRRYSLGKDMKHKAGESRPELGRSLADDRFDVGRTAERPAEPAKLGAKVALADGAKKPRAEKFFEQKRESLAQPESEIVAERLKRTLEPSLLKQVEEAEPPPPPAAPPPPEADRGGEDFTRIVDNPFLAPVGEHRESTFSIDVDTASYSVVRRYLTQGGRPPKDAVRIEEMINYFQYDYPQPTGKEPFSVNVEVARAPWNAGNRLVRIGLKGKEVDPDRRPPANLVFLVDVSGSMAPPNRLPMVKQGLKMLAERLGENDRVAVVVYAGREALALPSTNGTRKGEILSTLDQLESAGTTNGKGGLQLAYEVATAPGNFIKGGTNRIILATDGDFNVGITDNDQLVKFIEERRETGVALSVLGVGEGNLKDARMENLADKGNGNYAYLDTLAEARKVLIEQLSGTLVTIAKDVKIQVEFNPDHVGMYRLIGYENRALANQDFADDRKDAGEIGAGHTVTALYEVVPTPVAARAEHSRLLTVRLRYKEPDGDTSRLIERPLADDGKGLDRASADFKFAAAVASFGMILRDSPYKGNATLAAVYEWAASSQGADTLGYRREFVGLVEQAKAIWSR